MTEETKRFRVWGSADAEYHIASIPAQSASEAIELGRSNEWIGPQLSSTAWAEESDEI